MFLTRYTQLTFFNIHFPSELLCYINQFFIKCREYEMECLIHDSNICPCTEDKCIKKWYKGREKYDIETEWCEYHCSESDCHNIFDYSLFSTNNGIVCTSCEKPVCVACMKYSYDDDDDYNNDDYCIKCRRVYNMELYDVSSSNSQSLGSEDSEDESFDGWLVK